MWRACHSYCTVPLVQTVPCSSLYAKMEISKVKSHLLLFWTPFQKSWVWKELREEMQRSVLHAERCGRERLFPAQVGLDGEGSLGSLVQNKARRNSHAPTSYLSPARHDLYRNPIWSLMEWKVGQSNPWDPQPQDFSMLFPSYPNPLIPNYALDSLPGTTGSKGDKITGLFPRAAITEYHRLCGLKQQKFIPSQFWRPGVQNQSVIWGRLPGKAPFLSMDRFSLASPASSGLGAPWPMAVRQSSCASVCLGPKLFPLLRTPVILD